MSTNDAPHKLTSPNDPAIAIPVSRTPANAKLYLFATQLPPINVRLENIIIRVNVTEKNTMSPVTLLLSSVVKLSE